MYERKRKSSGKRTGNLPVLLPRGSETGSLEDNVNDDNSFSEDPSTTHKTPPTRWELDNSLSGLSSSSTEPLNFQTFDFDTDLASRSQFDLSQPSFIGNETSNLNFMTSQRSQGAGQDPGGIPLGSFTSPNRNLVDDLIHAYFSLSTTPASSENRFGYIETSQAYVDEVTRYDAPYEANESEESD